MNPGRVQPARQCVRPAIVAVRGCAVSICNGIAEDDHSEPAARSHIDAGELIPMINFPGTGKVRRCDKIPMSHVGCRARAWMPRLLFRRIAEVNADGEIGAGRYGVVQRIGNIFRAGRHQDIASTRKTQRPVAGRGNRRRTPRRRTCDVH